MNTFGNRLIFKGELKAKIVIFCITYLESLTSIKSSLDSYSCPFLGFCEKISFETVFFLLSGHFHYGPVMHVSSMR